MYLKRVLERFGMTDCNPRMTPLPPSIVLTKEQTPQTTEQCTFMADKPYRELLRSIMYAQIATQPDLSYARSMLSKYASNPGKTHWNALTHVLRYIRGTLGFRITYGGKHNDLAPIGYVNTDYAGDLNDRCSRAGHVFVQAGGPTAWGSQYQPTIALSTTEAEYMALTRVMKQILWMYAAMDEAGYPQPKPAILYNDNSGAVLLMQNTKNNIKVKHIDIRYHYICKRVEDGEIEVRRIASTNNLTDMFTKQLPRVTFQKHCAL